VRGVLRSWDDRVGVLYPANFSSLEMTAGAVNSPRGGRTMPENEEEEEMLERDSLAILACIAR
jgi:hypothetical protein